ncbi:hypothetical protein OPQ81_001421 [Rhizoctonia solani]|nr:hypothetical protein OPQ81_001421 [Rhizoctonia solani]
MERQTSGIRPSTEHDLIYANISPNHTSPSLKSDHRPGYQKALAALIVLPPTEAPLSFRINVCEFRGTSGRGSIGSRNKFNQHPTEPLY